MVEAAEPENGIYQRSEFPRDRYDAIGRRVNFSTAKEMARSPEHYAHAVKHGGGPDTNPRKLGRVTHMAVFEPEAFVSGVEVWEGKARRGGAWEEFQGANEGKELVTRAEYFQVCAIAKAVREHPIAGKYTCGGAGEMTLLWTHKVEPIGGLDGYALDCRARVDYLTQSFISDLKVVRDASPDGFGRACCNYRTFTQAAVYSDAVKVLTGRDLPYYLLAVESSAPYSVAVYRVPDEVLAIGRDEYRGWFDRIHACRRDAKWPGYAEAEMELTLPRWAAPSAEDVSAEELDLEVGG